ncbi:hypothetical protein WA171_000115 [Blastocystis sp. BT1]
MSLWDKMKTKSHPGRIKSRATDADEYRFNVPVGLRRSLNADSEEEGDSTQAKSPKSPLLKSLSFRETDGDKDIQKYKRLLESDRIDMKTLRSLAWKGIPSEYRAVTWKLLLGYLPSVRSRQQAIIQRKRKEYMEYIPRLYDVDDSERTEDELAALHQISVDVPRTSCSSIILKSEDVQLRLKRLLYIWANRHPACGYVQGINDLCVPFLVTFLNDHFPDKVAELDWDEVDKSILDEVEADTYYCISRLLDGIQDHYTTDQPGIQRMVKKLEDLVRRIDLDLYNHIQQEGLLFLQFAFRYMNCLLIREFSMRTIIRLWDTYLSETNGFDVFHVYVCAVFIKLSHDDLMEKDFQSMLLYLQNPPTEDWTEQDVEELLSQAFILKSLFEETSI